MGEKLVLEAQYAQSGRDIENNQADMSHTYKSMINKENSIHNILRTLLDWKTAQGQDHKDRRHSVD
jgi:hypothetical protein